MTGYLKKHNITNKELLEKHIEELRCNTVVNEVLISNLFVFNFFSANFEDKIFRIGDMKYYKVGLGITPKFKQGGEQHKTLTELIEIIKHRENSTKEIKTEKKSY